MDVIISDFPKLVEIIDTHPDWRQQLVNVLFPDIDLAESMLELKQALNRLEERADEAAEDRRQIYVKLDEAAEDRQQIYVKLDEAAEDRRRIYVKLDEAAEDRRRIYVKLDEAAEDRRRIYVKLDEAAEDRRRIYVKLDEAAEDRRRIETKFDAKLDEAAEDRRQMTVRLDVLHQDVATLKGLSYERTIRDIATGIFGFFIRRGKDAKGKISVQLYEAVTAGKISEHEFIQVMAIDLLWSGMLHLSGLNVVLAIEASWRAELNDIERAVTRANILRKIEINALPVVAGNIWDDQMIDLALERGVVIVDAKQVNKDTWNLALHAITSSDI